MKIILPSIISTNYFVFPAMTLQRHFIIKTEYGNNFSMKARDYLSLNKLKFVFTHSDKEKERKNTPVSQLKTAVGDVQFYIDHIIITQGGAYVNPPKF